MAKNYKDEEIPAEYGNDELLWRLSEFDPKENSDYWQEKQFAEQVCAHAGVALQQPTTKMVDRFCDEKLRA